MRIKRIIMGILALLPSLTLLAQQEVFSPRFMAGFTGGVNLSNMIFQPKVDQGLKIGYDGGIILRYDVVPYAGIWLEVDYSSRGWREKPMDLPELKYTRTLNFINIPVMTHFMIGNGPLKVTIDAGTHFGYLLSEQSEGNFPENRPNGVVVAQHNMPVENKFAWGIGGGLGGEYHLKNYVAGVRISYVYGLGEIYGNTRKDYFGKSSEQVAAAKVYFLFKF